MNQNSVQQCVVRPAATSWMLSITLSVVLLSGCSEPPPKMKSPLLGPPRLTRVDNEAQQVALNEARGEPQAHFVKRSDAKSAGVTGKSDRTTNSRRTTAKKKPAPQRTEVVSTPALQKKQNLGPGLISTPISAYWGAKADIAKAQITHALNLYKAQHGKPPQTHDEFVKEILDPANIKLPKLRDGERYRFDPSRGPLGELMVEKPKTLKE